MISPFLIGTCVLMVLCILILGLLYFNNNRNKMRNVRLQQAVLCSKLEMQEQLHKIVSKEIHDNIGQMLSLAKLNLNRMNSISGMDEQMLTDAKELIGKCIKDLRNLSKTLDSENIANRGFIKAMENEIQILQKATLNKVNLKWNGGILRLTEEKELILYRVFQEVLHTIINHTEASTIQIKAICTDTSFELYFSSNDVGLPHSIEKHVTSGLSTIKSRLQLIGATWQVISTPETETRFHIYLPISE